MNTFFRSVPSHSRRTVLFVCLPVRSLMCVGQTATSHPVPQLCLFGSNVVIFPRTLAHTHSHTHTPTPAHPRSTVAISLRFSQRLSSLFWTSCVRVLCVLPPPPMSFHVRIIVLLVSVVVTS